MGLFRFPLAIAALLCAGCVSFRTTSDTGASPSQLHYESVGLPIVHTTRYNVTDGLITKRVTTYSYPLRRQQVLANVSRRPAPNQWRDFWRKMADLGVSHWKSIYSPEQVNPRTIISDGHCWSFSYRSDSIAVRTSGCNAYPVIRQPQRTTFDETAFSRLGEALECLVLPATNQPMQITARGAD
jgi:hypothetical protein